MRVDIWSDVVCPFCFLGVRHFDAARREFAHGDELEIELHSFELDARAPHEHPGSIEERLSRKYGMTIDQAHAANDRLRLAGEAFDIDFRFERARTGNTFDAHRLLHLARDRGVQVPCNERLLRAYFTEGELISDHDVLARLATEVGLDADEVRAVLDGDTYSDAVRADEEQALELGITGVPFFVIDRRFAISGAQPPDVMLDVLERAWARAEAEAQDG